MNQASTCGILNHINQKYFCTSKRNSIAIQNLIRHHQPKQKQELIALISSHQSTGVHRNCSCGSKSKGTLETFSQNLWSSYQHYIKTNPHTPPTTLENCRVFIYNLFITHSLKGNQMELKIQRFIKQNIKRFYGISCDVAPTLYDFKYGVDLTLGHNSKEILGIQVKPISYLKMSDEHPVKLMNQKKNDLYPKEVLYIYYNTNESIFNTNGVMKQLMKYIK